MVDSKDRIAAGVDAGTEYVKAVIVTVDGEVLGRAVVAARGHFQACVREVLAAALDDAQRGERELEGLGATGFARDCVPGSSVTATDMTCHARGAFHHLKSAMTLVDIGGRDPHVLRVDATGRCLDARQVRRCGVGVGSFLMFTARHLDVSATGLQNLAAAAAQPAPVSSYCSVFSSTEVLERLREGAPREDIALGSLHSIAERIMEMGGFHDPVFVCGGVPEYFPGVVHAMETLSGLPVRVCPEPIQTAALGAAMKVFQAARAVRGLTGAAG